MAKLTDREKEMVTAAFDLGKHIGYSDAEEKLQGRIENIMEHCAKACGEMRRDILRLDELHPVNGIVLTYDEAEKLITSLKTGKSTYWARVLRKKINESNPDADKIIEMIRRTK